jgi:hypothetical protein
MYYMLSYDFYIYQGLHKSILHKRANTIMLKLNIYINLIKWSPKTNDFLGHLMDLLYKQPSKHTIMLIKKIFMIM